MANTALKTDPGSVFKTGSVAECKDAWTKECRKRWGFVSQIVCILQGMRGLKGTRNIDQSHTDTRRISRGMRGIKAVRPAIWTGGSVVISGDAWIKGLMSSFI